MASSNPEKIGRYQVLERVGKGGRLLEDFLEHEVLVAALLRRDRIPQHPLRRLGDFAAAVVGELHAGARDDRHLLVAEEHDVSRVAEDCRDVGGDEELPLAKADDDRRAVANRDDLVRIVGRHEHQREEEAGEPDEDLERPPSRRDAGVCRWAAPAGRSTSSSRCR